jgi:hypothetical protein
MGRDFEILTNKLNIDKIKVHMGIKFKKKSPQGLVLTNNTGH